MQKIIKRALNVPTENILKEWRFGSIQAERLCAGILSIEGFEGVDPQCPLGGPDGLKDIICYKDGLRLVSACFFPPTQQDYGAIKTKFLSDVSGVKKNEADGFIFFTNQRLSPSERTDLVKIATCKITEIYHIERIRLVLDSPKGYGLRLEYLRIPMTESEQVGFFDQLKSDISNHFIVQERKLLELSTKMDLLMERTAAGFETLLSSKSSLLKTQQLPEFVHFATANITLGQLCWIHRIITEEGGVPPDLRGTLRSIQVWIGLPNATIDTATFIPTAPEEIPLQINTLLTFWRDNYGKIINEPPENRIKEIADFHHKFLSIHPFVDGNGRLARSILQQQIIELLNKTLSAKFTDDPIKYFVCLKSADTGDLVPLRLLITANLE